MFSRVWVFVIGALLSSLSVANNLGFAEGSFYNRLDKDESESFKLQINDVMKDSANQETILWKSNSSSKEVRLKVKNRYKYADSNCVRGLAELREDSNNRKIYSLDFCEETSMMGMSSTWKFLVEPTSKFGDSDWESFQKALVDGLNAEADGNKRQWDRQDEPFNANFNFINSAAVGNTKCRNVDISISAGADSHTEDRYRFCNSGSAWKLVPSRERFE